MARFSAEQLERIKSLYATEGILSISKKMESSPVVIRRTLKEMGVELRVQGQRAGIDLFRERLLTEGAALAEKGLNGPQIAKEIGCSIAAVYCHLQVKGCSKGNRDRRQAEENIHLEPLRGLLATISAVIDKQVAAGSKVSDLTMRQKKALEWVLSAKLPRAK